MSFTPSASVTGPQPNREALGLDGIDRIDIVYIHDPDVNNSFQQALDEAFPTLADLKSQGIIGAVGAGMNQAEMLCDFAISSSSTSSVGSEPWLMYACSVDAIPEVLVPMKTPMRSAP